MWYVQECSECPDCEKYCWAQFEGDEGLINSVDPVESIIKELIALSVGCMLVLEFDTLIEYLRELTFSMLRTQL